MAKARCPGCSSRMRAKDKFCGACGKRNPLFAPDPNDLEPSVKAGRPVLVKSAPAASVTEIRRAQLRRAIYAEADPGRREVFAGQLVDLMRGGAA
jgi:hypothetical protein